MYQDSPLELEDLKQLFPVQKPKTKLVRNALKKLEKRGFHLYGKRCGKRKEFLVDFVLYRPPTVIAGKLIKGHIALAVESELSDHSCRGQAYDFDKLMHVQADAKLFIACKSRGKKSFQKLTANEYLARYEYAGTSRYYLCDYSSESATWMEYRDEAWRKVD